MKTTVCSLLASLGVLAASSIPVQAAHHEAPQFVPVELMACTFKEGKGSEDLDKLTGAFTDWVRANDPEYSYYILTPRFRESGSDMDFAWLGGWGSGAAMGKGYDNWMAGDDGTGAMFADVMDCSYSLSSVAVIHMPTSEWTANGVVWFARCTLDDEATIMDAMGAHKAMGAAMRGMGAAESAQWAFLPALGFGDVKFDYYHVQSWTSYSALGSGFDVYFNEGGWMKAAETTAGRTDCQSPNLYDSRLIHSGQ